MGLFDWFRKEKKAPPADHPSEGTESPSAESVADTAEAPQPVDPVALTDEQGNRVMIEREVFSKILLDKVAKAESAEELENALLAALNEGLVEHCLEHAKRLYELNPAGERVISIVAHVFLQCERFDEAEQLIAESIDANGRRADTLFELAKLHQLREELPKRDVVLDEILSIDVNHRLAFEFRSAAVQETDGVEAWVAWTRTLAERPTAYRPQIWLARLALSKKDLDTAQAWYATALPRVGSDGPALMQISGDLGQAGFEREALELVLPVYDVSMHGPITGLNLLAACYSLEDRTAARGLVEMLQDVERPDLAPQIAQYRDWAASS